MKQVTSKSGIQISSANIEQLQPMIDATEGRAQMRCISVKDVIGLSEDAERHFDPLYITKGERVGARMTITAEGPGRSYKWRAEGTEVEMTRRSKGWYLTEVRRVGVLPGSNKKRRLQLTEKQKAAARARFEKKLEAA